jgi:putative ABC transport system permease protein
MSQFLGVPTVTMPLSELQASVGKTGTDPASIMTVRLHEGENVSAMESELQRAYPGYDVRTNREQLESTVQRQAVVIAGGASLVALAVVAGLALTLNVLLSLIQQQRATLAALKAVGCSSVTLAGVIAAQAIVVGIVGATIGVALVTPLAVVLDAVALAVTGFENVVRTSDELIALGFGVAVLMSLFSAVVAGSRIRVLSAVEALD